MNILQFKQIDTDRLDELTVFELQQLLLEGQAIASKMTACDTEVWQIMDKIAATLTEKRGC